MNSKRESRVRLGFTIVCCFLVLTCSDEKSSPSPILGLVDSSATDNSSSAFSSSGVSRAVAPSLGSSPYLVGAGIYDITGPAAEVGMMGFAESAQKTEGIYMRLWSRAYIIGDASKRVVFVSADLGMIFQSIKQAVSKKIALDAELSPYYNQANVLLSATHTHSGPGGYSHYFLYNATTSGFIKENFDVIVDGIYRSIKLAHQNLVPGNVYINQGNLTDASKNRSVAAYDKNPVAERNFYSSNVDQTMTLLKLVAADGRELGMLNWFAVHPTNVGPTNKLIGGDNKGLASYLFEKTKGTNYSANQTFVAAFAQTNSGDVTPNLWGPADGVNDYARQNIIAEKQLNRAQSLYSSATTQLSGSVDFRHTFVNFSNLYVSSVGTTTCQAGMGASFSAGSVEDNAVSLDFFDEGTTVDSLDWNTNSADAFKSSFLGGALGVLWPASTSEAYKLCHAEKPVLIPTGVASFDGNPWTPPVIPMQIIKIGNLAILAIPAEVSTMAGRRLRSLVKNVLANEYTVIAGLSNSYTSYLTTREEYSSQQYEGASTQFGPNTLVGYEQEFGKLASALRNGSVSPAGPTPADLTNYQATFQTGVVFDDIPLFKSFGNVFTQPASSYANGATVSAVFWGAHPKNNMLIGSSFVDVEKQNGSTWTVVARDNDPSTTYKWQRDGIAYSKVTVTWKTSSFPSGTYRIRHRGHWKSGWTGAISAYQGVTNNFTVQ
ncbi:alkaline ceramidase [Leptospira congkakensis]|uniref:Neutral ceramidase n=1 Tax=Leptospira congkakensis TaxID=2484932 RepID=A0A4Z1AB94_9LEPT|nr:neutral/alkaline ceramidase [Leptospira congkakensis]TGL87174.1 alkaline ceramidase [Leptospira congkakensis]TGL96742.1 alkaline ceramidase [Leptospira congkakensis]TGL97591.1 alkaline ceramidase [Leptospira congkakensis]